MDPSGPWYTSYNRLTAAPSGTEQILQLTSVPTTAATQLLIPTTVTLAGQPSSFNPGGFLSNPTAVGYDILTPFFTKQTAHYVTTQPIRAQVVTTLKTCSPELDNSALRSSYIMTQPDNTFFEHQTTTATPSSVNWSLTQPTNTQITSPFGILPHESVSVTSPASSTKVNSAVAVAYENPFNTHNSRAQSPINNSVKCIVTESSLSGAHNFFQNTTAFDSDGLTDGYSPEDTTTDTPTGLHHQSCIVTTPSITAGNRITQLPARSPVSTTIYLNANNAPDKTVQDAGHDSSQSSPISFSIMDSRNLSYNANNGSGKIQTPNGTVQFQIVNQQQPQQQQTTNQQPSSCRLYSTTATEAEYHHPVRSKSAASTDSAYSSNTSQNGPDCTVVVPRRPSPMQAHSQASPLGHVPSPATYPMYNSPMASMSSPSPLHADASTPYKTTNVQQQMTPPSPLDVTITRSPSQQNQVVYSSVITRALGAYENKAYPTDATNRTTFERSPDFSQSKQMCWDNENRKFATSNYLTPDASETNVLSAQQIQRLPDQQSSCLEVNQMNLQNLNSCRGDSMSIVKNLRTDHDNDDDAEEQRTQQVIAGAIGVKRKNLEDNDEFVNRIPPPAHHNTIINQQPQQNGYMEYERWNLTTMPHTKLIATAPATFVAQQPQQQSAAQVHHAANFLPGNATVAQQPLLVSHQATPTVSYFPGFQIAPGTTVQQQSVLQTPTHHPQELPSTVDMNAVAMDTSCQHNDSSCLDDPMDKPQVIVPNIEEELDFLQEPELVGLPPVNNQLVNTELKRSVNTDPNSGFMTSYLKFLQGEKDSSPPPPNRGKKASWTNMPPYTPLESNSSDAWNKNNTQSEKSNEVSTIDYENDPRYFPLPKERKKRDFDSSDDGFSSDDELPPFGTKKSEKKSTTTNDGVIQVDSHPPIKIPRRNIAPDGRPKKGRPIKPGGPTDRKRKAAAAAAEAAAKGIVLPVNLKKKQLQLPRRESSRRKAKEKSTEKQEQSAAEQQPADPYDVEEEGDSDNDPAWTPAAKANGDEQDKRKKSGRPVIGKRKRLVEDISVHNTIHQKRAGRKRRNPIDVNARANAIKLSCKIDEKLLASVSDEDIDISPFKHSTFGDDDDPSGEFVVLKSDLNQEYPPLWRIDGKTLLQKYEPFQSNGKTLYKNISTYSGWAPQNRHIYQQVPVKFWQQGKMETIVEFLRDELIMDDSEFIIKFMKDTEKYQDNFEVYIQTLISQALDSNFLTEIFQEQDDYFLLNVKTVDEITEERKQQLLSTTTWRPNVVTALSTWPCINVLRDNLSDYKGKSCEGCNRCKIHSRVLLYGQPYNSTTLEGSPPGPEVPQEKDFVFCRMCQKKVALFNKVAHQKYLMFLECARRVADKRLADPNKDTTIILNELLADESWLNLLFREVRNIWAEIDILQQQAKKKAAIESNESHSNQISNNVS